MQYVAVLSTFILILGVYYKVWSGVDQQQLTKLLLWRGQELCKQVPVTKCVLHLNLEAFKRNSAIFSLFQQAKHFLITFMLCIFSNVMYNELSQSGFPERVMKSLIDLHRQYSYEGFKRDHRVRAQPKLRQQNAYSASNVYEPLTLANKYNIRS